ncbi:hypothetical protein MMC24_003047 [Lignoscripta atroalba]|nr:hypothetical protein [Lignoscripta atroalba]
MRVTHAQLPGAHLLSKCYHLICTASRCIELVKGILEARAKLRQENKIRLVDELKPFDPPLFVWEPVPDSCVPSEMLIVLEALRHVDVISPNHHELASLFGETGPDPFMASELQVLERQCNELLSRGFGKKPSAVVVRRGERGCYVASNIRHTWFPAYHRPRDELNRKEQRTWTQKVVDPTGGGNAFLGGYCIGLLDLHLDGETEFERGAIHGTIAASFAIEQVGMPQLSHADDGRELWNGEWVGTRWEKYCKNLPLDRLDLNQSKEASLYGSVSSVIFGTKITRMTRIPADFEGNRHVPKD